MSLRYFIVELVTSDYKMSYVFKNLETMYLWENRSNLSFVYLQIHLDANYYWDNIRSIDGRETELKTTILLKLYNTQWVQFNPCHNINEEILAMKSSPDSYKFIG